MLTLLKAFGENYALKFNEMIPKDFGCCADKNCPEKVKHGEFCCVGAPLIYLYGCDLTIVPNVMPVGWFPW